MRSVSLIEGMCLIVRSAGYGGVVRTMRLRGTIFCVAKRCTLFCVLAETKTQYLKWPLRICGERKNPHTAPERSMSISKSRREGIFCRTMRQ